MFRQIFRRYKKFITQPWVGSSVALSSAVVGFGGFWASINASNPSDIDKIQRLEEKNKQMNKQVKNLSSSLITSQAEVVRLQNEVRNLQNEQSQYSIWARLFPGRTLDRKIEKISQNTQNDMQSKFR